MTELDVARARRVDDQFQVAPATVLKLALEKIERGEIAPQRALVLLVTDLENGQLGVDTFRSNLPWQKEIVLLEVQKANRMFDEVIS